jgi:hypothetical protein
VVSPFVKPGYVAKRHYVTASIVKTAELMLGLPPNNLGDLFATDLRDMFQAKHNGITANRLRFNRTIAGEPSPEGKRIWELVDRLDLSGPDRDSYRVARLGRLSIQADTWHAEAKRRGRLDAPEYRRLQARLYTIAQRLTAGPPIGDD